MNPEIITKLLAVALAVIGLAGAAMTIVGWAVKGAFTLLTNHMKHLEDSTDRLVIEIGQFKDKVVEMREREAAVHMHVVDTCNETARMWKDMLEKTH